MPEVSVSSTLLDEIDRIVASGAFPSRDAAIAELLRLGLEAFRAAKQPVPGRPPAPPGRRDPGDDRPISVDPTDVNWAD